MPTTMLSPVHPGEVLLEEFLKPLNISLNSLALEVHVPLSRVSNIVNGKRVITASTALRLSAFFGTSAEFWLNLQSNYDLELSRLNDAETISRQVRRFSKSAQRMVRGGKSALQSRAGKPSLA